MGCYNCHQTVPFTPEPVPEGPPFVMRKTAFDRVTGIDDKVYLLVQPLVPAARYPRGHWAATVTVKGIPRVIDRPTGIEVFNEAMRLFQLNEEEFWFVNIWLNLNLQWIPRLPERYRIVTVEQLEAISEPA